MSTAKSLAALAAAVALLLSACGRDTREETPQTLDVVATDFAFSGVPPSFRGGLVEINFRNEGGTDHEMVFVDLGDASLDNLREDFPGFIEGGPWPDYFQAGVGIDAEPGESISTTMTLPAGDYLLVCALDGVPGQEEGEEAEPGQPHYDLGMFQENVTVTDGDGELTARDGEIVARDYTFDVPELRAGRNELVFRNESPREWHHLVAFLYPEGINEQQATEAFGQMLEAEEDAPPPEGVPEPEEAGFTGFFSPGLGQTFELELESGRTYVFACFLHDLEGGPPHAVAHDMFVAYTVP